MSNYFDHLLFFDPRKKRAKKEIKLREANTGKAKAPIGRPTQSYQITKPN